MTGYEAKWLFLTILAVFIAGVVLSVLVIETKVDTDVDIVAMNEIVKTVESHWGHIEQGDYSAIKLQFTIIDNSGQCALPNVGQYTSTTINDAIKNRSTIIDVM